MLLTPITPLITQAGRSGPGLGRPGPPQTLSEELRRLLRRNKFCMGVKRGGEYVCGGDAGEGAKDKAVGLLSEAIERIRRWRVWDDWWIIEWMDEWLERRDRLEVQLRGRYSEEVINDLLGMVNKFIGYNERFLNYWRSVGDEVRRLIDDLMSGRVEVIIWEGEKGISVYYEHVTLEAHRTSTGGVTVQLVLNGLEGMTIEVPNIFIKTMSEKEYRKFVNDVLRALKGGFEETDGFIEKGHAAMTTTQIWQVIAWALLYPGENYVHVDAINVNENDVTIEWHLKSNGHKSIKGKLLNNVDKLSKEELPALMFTAILGDGYADVVKLVINGRVYDKAVIKITMSGKKLDTWEPLLERLKGMGFGWRPYPVGGAVDVRFYDGNAIDLARAMINALPPILKDIFDALSFEKWLSLRRIAEMEVKWRSGEMQIIVVGYKFSVSILKGTVVLVHKAKDDAEVKIIVNALRARYGDEFVKYVRVNKSGKYLAVKIPMYVFERYEDIKSQVIEVLCRKLEKTKDEKKRQIIIKHLKRLTTPTKGAPRP
ncbi:hypothetical protein [Vulcanisaeta sp. JCM 14467]|uniref:hypothetical protein n=1 Tax=Vulcanisaeta sp. JCM 14467 TaxID=1295370 RepID=UPI0006D0E75E|nr:hypothetical protein [Vulcanisaeta sp. JCM 14467]